MWLLDVNLPNGLMAILREHGIHAETTAYRGWRNLGNGKLSEALRPMRPASGHFRIKR
jgi:hypothetical protein